MHAWLAELNQWLGANPQWLGATIFIVACIECLAVAGLIVPGTVALFAVSALAGGGALGLGDTLLLGYAGGLLGDGLSYAIGRGMHENIRRLPGLRSHPQWLGGAETFIQRYGVASLLVGRFIGPLRPMLPMVAGMLEMPLPRFILVSLVAAAGWSVAYLLPGWMTGAAVRLPLPPGFWPQAAVVVIGLLVLIGLAVNSSLRRQPSATVVTSAASFVLMLSVFLGWPYLTHFDEGLVTLVQEHRSELLDRIVVAVTRLGDFRTQLCVGVLLTSLLLVARHWRHALFAGGVLLCTALGNGTLKWLFARTRPEVLSTPLSTYSMPSGHSSASFAFFLVLAVLASRGQPPRMRLTWVLMACIPALSIALSRVYLGAHWPTDVLAGALLAVFVCAAGLAITLRVHRLEPLGWRTWVLLLVPCLLLFAWFTWHDLANALARYAY
ncbi:bifunctional DedA family/phosphatase PAP2 family protein [Pseudomonas japonica]|uniref:bifunctional DedA family/phosphatase PAP2 family protein n=1 Tax=Pseudomonas japonica TaxID=256466 RepID=UPI0015E32517|nr:bifunctional DedA family/phosphatase PAP2 family protein [Pseudomonas japonica]MBA1244981.1 phosphatase PAP2 family protein [Pseudomonas japonica]MBA1290808.1 phosphatase PAP2 family protein [Pseudomonas japonica]